MSLLMNEDFSIYQLRLGYLNQIKDGVGERLITLNPAVLNDPAFRTAGWTPDFAAIKRCYSPPIPTGTSGISNEYFQAPRRPTIARVNNEDGMEGGGMVTGHQGSEETLGPVGLHANERKRERRRRKEQLEEDDSSDLSDDSDEEEKTLAQSIKFSKMPVRNRAASSPPTRVGNLKAEIDRDGPAVMVTSPSRPLDPPFQRLRRGSAGGVELVKQRARRDTTTSSEMSSENELPPEAFRRKIPSRPSKGPSVLIREEHIQEEGHEGHGHANSDLEDEDDDIDVGEASDLSDEFEGSAESPSLLVIAATGASDGLPTPPTRPMSVTLPAITPSNTSPRKALKDSLVRIPKLPPEQRPRSMAQPVSMISMMLRGGNGNAEQKPFQQFADMSGKGEASPLWIKIYLPFSEDASEPIEVPLRRTKDDRPALVADLIGLALWRYCEEEREPALLQDETNVNRWNLRIVDDDEIDLDFPPLGRTRPMTDFTSNNNRPPLRRVRDKPWDEFGLAKATDEQFKENETLTPQKAERGSGMPPKTSIPMLEPLKVPTQLLASDAPQSATSPAMPSFNPAHNPITGPSFAPNALRKDSSAVFDLPQREGRQAAPKTGAPRTIIVNYTNPQSFIPRSSKIETTTDSYIAEVFEQSCKIFDLDKALHALRVHGMQNFAPTDRTVEALGRNLLLDLVPRLPRNIFGMEFSGSPGSTPPNAPLDLTPANATPKKKTRTPFPLHPLAAQQKAEMNTASASFLNLSTVASRLGGEGRRYNVLRKQPLSFAATHPRTLIITPDYMTIMPAAPDSLARPTGKVTNVPMTSVIGAKVSRKHPKMVRILVYREKETKRYDFEAFNHQEAEEIVAEVRRGMEAFGAGVEVL